MPLSLPAPDKPSQFPEAASWFLGRLPMTREEWDKLSARAQRKAFMVTGVADADVIHTVYREIDRAIATGMPLGEFRKKVKDKLEQQWNGSVANPSWRIETIFRTNVQHAYAAGRVRQLRDPAILKHRPYWKLDVILDVSTSLVCEPLAGTTLPADHPWWKTHCPPLHFNCRSGIRALRKGPAEAAGITKDPPAGEVAKGFGLDPDASEWEPDLTRFPEGLRDEVEKRLASMPKPMPIEPPKPLPVAPKAKAEAPKAKAEAPKPKPEASGPKRPKVPPEHTEAYWIDTYKHLGPDAAQACARARANQERVLDMPPAKVKAAFDKSFWADETTFQVFFKRSAFETSKTFRDTLTDALPATRRLGEVIAALVGAQDLRGGRLMMTLDYGTTDKGLRKQLRSAKKALHSVLGKGFAQHHIIAYQMRYGSLKRAEPGNRAYCMGNMLVLDASHNMFTVIHETGHSIEAANDKAREAAFQFYESRTQGEPLVALKELTGRNYDDHERARRDKFFNAYVGKDYATNGRREATEVLSMGMEYVFKDPELLYREDKEHFLLSLGVLGTP